MPGSACEKLTGSACEKLPGPAREQKSRLLNRAA